MKIIKYSAIMLMILLSRNNESIFDHQNKKKLLNKITSISLKNHYKVEFTEVNKNKDFLIRMLDMDKLKNIEYTCKEIHIKKNKNNFTLIYYKFNDVTTISYVLKNINDICKFRYNQNNIKKVMYKTAFKKMIINYKKNNNELVFLKRNPSINKIEDKFIFQIVNVPICKK